MLTDVHSHKDAPYIRGIISINPEEFNPIEGQCYSVGLHPWHLPCTPDEVQRACGRLLEVIDSSSQIVAVGEAGFDTLRGGTMVLQTIAFRRQVEISEEFNLPMVIHAVKSLDMILGWRKESRAHQPWIIHGFRGKPATALQLQQAGCMLSFGERFNIETVRSVSEQCILVETDTSTLTIDDIIEKISEVRSQNMIPIIRDNMSRLFGKI